MALEFDITNNPHTLIDIKTERERVTKDRASFRGKNIRFLILFFDGIGQLCYLHVGVYYPSFK